MPDLALAAPGLIGAIGGVILYYSAHRLHRNLQKKLGAETPAE